MDFAIFKYLFSSTIYYRGLDYYHNNKVKVTYKDDKKALAVVEGSENYHTKFFFTDHKAKFECDCPYSGHCKHEAALLEFCINNPDLKISENNTGITLNSASTNYIFDLYKTFVSSKDEAESLDQLKHYFTFSSINEQKISLNHFFRNILASKNDIELKNKFISLLDSVSDKKIFYSSFENYMKDELFSRYNYHFNTELCDIIILIPSLSNCMDSLFYNLSSVPKYHYEVYQTLDYYNDNSAFNFSEKTLLKLLDNHFIRIGHVNKLIKLSVKKHYYDFLYSLAMTNSCFESDTRNIVSFLNENHQDRKAMDLLIKVYKENEKFYNFLMLYNISKANGYSLNYDELIAYGYDNLSTVNAINILLGVDAKEINFNKLSYEDIYLLKDRLMDEKYYSFIVNTLNKNSIKNLGKAKITNSEIIYMLKDNYFFNKKNFYSLIHEEKFLNHLNDSMNYSLDKDYISFLNEINQINLLGYHIYED